MFSELKITPEQEMQAALHSAKVFYQKYGEFLDKQRHFPSGKPEVGKRNKRISDEQLKIPKEMAIRGMEIAAGEVYPLVSRVINKLARNGIVTKTQLADIEYDTLRKIPGVATKYMEVILLLRNICKVEVRIQELKKPEVSV